MIFSDAQGDINQCAVSYRFRLVRGDGTVGMDQEVKRAFPLTKDVDVKPFAQRLSEAGTAALHPRIGGRKIAPRDHDSEREPAE
jgi:hypothetical protein